MRLRKATWVITGFAFGVIISIKASAKAPLTILVATNRCVPYDISAVVDAKKPFKYAVFGYLVHIDNHNVLSPSLLSDWWWDFEKSHYVFKIRKGLRFHNGRKVTSRDIEFSLTRWFLMDRRAFEKSYVAPIIGTSVLKTGEPFESGRVSGIQIVDDNTLTVAISVNNPSFILSLVDVPVVPIEELGRDYETWKKKPIGAGPYRLTEESQANGKYVLEAVDPKQPGPDIVHLLTTSPDRSDPDIVTAVDPADQKYQKVVLTDEFDWVKHIVFDFHSPLGADINFRRAIQFGIDRQRLADTLVDAVPAIQINPPSFWGGRVYRKLYDPEKARGYLSKVDEKLLKAPLGIPSSTKPDPYLDELKKQLEAIGIRVEYKGAWQKFYTSDEPIIRHISINVTTPDPILQFSFFHTGSPLAKNFPIENQAYDKIYLQASRTRDKTTKVRLIRELTDYFEDQAISIPIVATPPVFWVRKDLANKINLSGQRSAAALFIDRIKYD